MVLSCELWKHLTSLNRKAAWQKKKKKFVNYHNCIYHTNDLIHNRNQNRIGHIAKQRAFCHLEAMKLQQDIREKEKV